MSHLIMSFPSFMVVHTLMTTYESHVVHAMPVKVRSFCEIFYNDVVAFSVFFFLPWHNFLLIVQLTPYLDTIPIALITPTVGNDTDPPL